MILTVSSQKYRVSRSLFSCSGTECSHSEREKVQLGKQMNTQRFLFSTSFEGGATVGCNQSVHYWLQVYKVCFFQIAGKWKLKVTSAKPTYLFTFIS